MLVVMLLFLAALDSKEMAATLPAALLLYELLYHDKDFKSRTAILRTGGFLLVLFVLSAIYLRIKVADLGTSTNYRPHPSISFVLHGAGSYIDQLFYLKPESFGPAKVVPAAVLLLAIAAALRSRPIAYGTLFFSIAIVPVSVIAPRGGYAAYIAYPGLTLVIGTLLAMGRSSLIRLTKRDNLETASTVALFLCVALTSFACFAEKRKTLMSDTLWDQEKRIDFMTGFKHQVPDVPPNARFLILDDPWRPDWGPLFLATLMYHEPTIWIDRVRSGPQTLTGDRDSYDLLVDYRLPKLGTTPSRLFGFRKTWETHWIALGEGRFALSAPDQKRAPRDLGLSPSAARTGRPVTVTVPGLSNTKIDAIFRILSEGKSTVHFAQGWCMLDAEGKCSVAAPYAGPQGIMTVDWIRPSQGRWIFTNAVMPLVD
jgi:hypothetical protein